MSSSKQLIDDILSGKAMDIENTFQSIMADKITERLDAFRKEVAGTLFKESVEISDEQIMEDLMSLEELSQETINNYINRSAFDHVRSTTRSMGKPMDTNKKSLKNRILGIIRGKSKLTKEQVEIIESALLSEEELDEEVLDESYAKKYASAPDHVKRVADEMKRLSKLPKSKLVSSYPSRLDTNHLKSEPKDALVAGHLRQKFSRKSLEDHDKHFFG